MNEIPLALIKTDLFGHKKTTEIKMENVFHTIEVNSINKVCFKI